MKMVKMTQRTLAGGFIRGWLLNELDDAEFVRYMGQLLDEAQNPKNAGGHSDGSLSGPQWGALRSLQCAIATKRIILGEALAALGLDEEGNTRK